VGCPKCGQISIPNSTKRDRKKFRLVLTPVKPVLPLVYEVRQYNVVVVEFKIPTVLQNTGGVVVVVVVVCGG
jgi:hypothetical protein